MVNIIELKNINFKYKQKIIFNNLNLEINEGDFITITGGSGCGKTTLFKILLGLIKSEGTIEIDSLNLDDGNIKKIRSNIGSVFENTGNSLIEETVMDNFIITLKNLKVKEKDIKSRIDDISKKLHIDNILEYSINSLSGGEKQLVSLAIALSQKPKILLLDEAFTMIDNIQKDQIFKMLKKINKDEKMTIINFSSDIEQSLYSKRLCLLKEGNIILNEKISEAFNNEKIFKECNLELPFMASLCLKLKYYDLIDKVIFDMDKLVNELWK